MPSPIHPTLYVRKECDQFIVGPIGLTTKMPDQVLSSRAEAVTTVRAIRKAIPSPICMHLGPQEASQ